MLFSESELKDWASQVALCFSQEAGLRPNVQVFSALIGRAARRLDYVYLKTILKSMSDMRVWPNEVIIRQLEFAAQYPPNYNQVSTFAAANNGAAPDTKLINTGRTIDEGSATWWLM